MLEAVEFDELGRRGPDMIAIKERFETGTGDVAMNWQRLDQRIDAWLIEEGNGIAFLAMADDPVLGRLDAARGPSFQQLAEIHHQGVRTWWHIDPAAVARLRLQAGDTVLGE